MAGFKPMSSHDYWEHYDHSLACKSMGILASRDALMIRELMVDPPDIELLNPYHQLLCPLDVMRALQVADHYLEERPPHILAERLSSPKAGTTLFVNRKPDLFVAPEEFIEALSKEADRVETFQTSPVAEGLASVEEAIQASFEALARQREDIVVESFSDISSPLSFEEEELDLVISVGGSLVLFTEPAEVVRVQEIVRSQRMTPLLKYLKPAGVFRVPHLSSQQREDVEILAHAYSEVLDALWARV